MLPSLVNFGLVGCTPEDELAGFESRVLPDLGLGSVTKCKVHSFVFIDDYFLLGTTKAT